MKCSDKPLTDAEIITQLIKTVAEQQGQIADLQAQIIELQSGQNILQDWLKRLTDKCGGRQA